MRVWLVFSSLFLVSCGTEPGKRITDTQTSDTIITTADTSSSTADADLSFVKEESPVEEFPAPPPVKKPAGVYRFLLPTEKGQSILHTISFSAGTYRLQEEYNTKRDSIVVIQGTWAPSAGYIWLYKDQVVRGRYNWQGDTLQYYSPRLKKSFSMEKLTPARANQIWQTKRSEGAVLYAIGTEPFWSVEINRQDSLVLNMPDWKAPIRVKVNTATASADSTVYTSLTDSLSLTVYPHFCSDGMSDFLYRQRVKIIFKGQSFRGCGEQLRAAY
jgi:uncharacterized membrane protein